MSEWLTVLRVVLAGGVLVSRAYALLALSENRAWRADRRQQQAQLATNFTPAVTIFKPACGAEPDAAALAFTLLVMAQ